jgi:hypothetical protein
MQDTVRIYAPTFPISTRKDKDDKPSKATESNHVFFIKVVWVTEIRRLANRTSVRKEKDRDRNQNQNRDGQGSKIDLRINGGWGAHGGREVPKTRAAEDKQSLRCFYCHLLRVTFSVQPNSALSVGFFPSQSFQAL